MATARNGASTGSAAGGAGIREQRQHHELPVLLLGQERHGRCRHDVDHGAQLLGCRLGKAHELRDGVNRRGDHEHSADHSGQWVKAVGERGGHAETAAATAERPEEVGMVLRVRNDDASIGGDELDREEVVDGQPVRPAEEPGTTAEGDAADTDRAGVTEPDDEPVLARCGRDGACRGTPADPGDALVDVDVDAVEMAEVEDETVLDGAVGREAVAAAPDGELEPGRPGERNGGCDVVRVAWSDDDSGSPVEVSVVELVCGLESLGVGSEDLAGDGVTQRPQSVPFDGQWSMCGGHGVHPSI